MRRFVADASHELRTPLTSIRGFAELYRQGAVRSEEDVAPADGAHRGRGRPHGAARRGPAAARPDGPAAPAHPRAGRPRRDRRRRGPRRDAVQPDRPIALHLDESLTDVPVVRGDEGRLRQVVGNLRHQRADAHPGRHAGHRHRGRGADDPESLVLGSPTRARAWSPPTPRGRSSASTGPTRRAPAAPAAPASGCRSSSSLVAAHGGSVGWTPPPGGCHRIVRLPRSGPLSVAAVRRGRREERPDRPARSAPCRRTPAAPIATLNCSRLSRPRDGAARADRGLGHHDGRAPRGARAPGAGAGWHHAAGRRAARSRNCPRSTPGVRTTDYNPVSGIGSPLAPPLAIRRITGGGWPGEANLGAGRRGPSATCTAG